MATTAFCTKCGGQLPAGATFCTICGAAVEEAGAPAARPAASAQPSPRQTHAAQPGQRVSTAPQAGSPRTSMSSGGASKYFQKGMTYYYVTIGLLVLAAIGCLINAISCFNGSYALGNFGMAIQSLLALTKEMGGATVLGLSSSSNESMQVMSGLFGGLPFAGVLYIIAFLVAGAGVVVLAMRLKFAPMVAMWVWVAIAGLCLIAILVACIPMNGTFDYIAMKYGISAYGSDSSTLYIQALRGGVTLTMVLGIISAVIEGAAFCILNKLYFFKRADFFNK